MSEELKIIKKIYGEKMMQLCRELFSTILEKPGVLLSILEKNLAPTHYLANSVIVLNLQEEFKDWIFSFVDVERKFEPVTTKTPFELLDEAGYTLYECKDENDIQSFRKYYAPDEELCTFKGGRLNRCYVFFAVKKNVDEIKRENFSSPKRQDEYGTSVISLQFSRGKTHDLSIKNRYNHTVNQPDSTFSNNLDNIIPGLTNSFENYFGFSIGSDRSGTSYFLEELNYVRGGDGRYYRSNIEVNASYYCENNIILADGQVVTEYAENKERYLLIEQFLVDFKEKKIVNMASDDDAFVKSVNDAGTIKDIRLIKNSEERVVKVIYDDGAEANIVIDRHNAIIGYSNDKVTEIGDNFLEHNKTLESISLPNVISIGSKFLYQNDVIKKISFPKVQYILDDFMKKCSSLLEIDLPQVVSIGTNFLFSCESIETISFPNLESLSKGFLGPAGSGKTMIKDDSKLRRVYLPKLLCVPDWFMSRNNTIEEIDLSSAQLLGNFCLYSNQTLRRFFVPEVVTIGNKLMPFNKILEILEAPKVKEIGESCLGYNESVKRVYLPEVEVIGENFMKKNECIEEVFMPNLEGMGANCSVCFSKFLPEEVLLNGSSK